MEIRVNGLPRELDIPLTVSGLLELLELDPRRVAVELNREILPRDRFEEHGLKDGDALEIVQFVGGG